MEFFNVVSSWWIIRRLRYSLAWWRWFFTDPIDMVRPYWREKSKTRDILLARHAAKQPLPQDYGIN